MALQSIISKGKTLMYNAGIETVKEYVEGRRTTAVNPRIVLEVTPFIPPALPIEFLSENMGGIVQSVTFSKDRTKAGGTISIEMAADDERVAANMPVGYPLRALWASQGASLRDLFRPMMMSKLWMDGYHVATMVLRDFKKSTAPGKRSYHAEFEELGSVYNQSIPDYQTIFDLTLNTRIANTMTKAMDAGGTIFGLPLHLALMAYVAAFNASSLAYGMVGFPLPFWRASDGIPLSLRLLALPAPFGGIATSSLISQSISEATLFQQAGGSSFWEFLKSLAPEPFMELFTESGGRTICTGRIVPPALSFNPGVLGLTRFPAINVTPMLPGFSYLIARSVPYDNPLLGFTPWLNVYGSTLGIMDLLVAGDFVIVTDDDVVSKELGTSDRQQATMFYVEEKTRSSSESFKFAGSPSGGPIIPIFPGGARTFGLRVRKDSVPATGLQFSGLVGQSLERLTKSIKIAAPSTLSKIYFRNASKFNEGTITTKWKPYARPGMYLLYLPSLSGTAVDDTRDLGSYYIDSLTHSYTNTGAPSTTFNVIRGTPLPISLGDIASILMEWECHPPGLSLFDGEWPS